MFFNKINPTETIQIIQWLNTDQNRTKTWKWKLSDQF